MTEPPPAAAATTLPIAAPLMARRFRGFLPVVIDVETGGFHAATDALLQIAAVLIEIDGSGRLYRGQTHSFHVKPFEGARLDPASLQVNKIDPWHPLRPALDEREALQRMFREVRAAVRAGGCRRAVLVGHNASFDLNFLNAAVARTGIKRNPFHPFSSFDTATLAGAAFGQTVLAKVAAIAGLEWQAAAAHSATYDAEHTADVFCLICNELNASFARAEQRARELGWQEPATLVPAEEAQEPPEEAKP
jgi:ribonuclease T